MFTYKVSHIHQQAEVELAGDLDIDGEGVFRDQLLPELKQYNRVTLNFADVPVVDSTGMSSLVKTVQLLKEQGTHVTISHVRKEVLDVFYFLQLPDIVGKGVFTQI